MYFNVRIKRIVILLVCVIVNSFLIFSVLVNRSYALTDSKNIDNDSVKVPIIMYHSVMKSRKSLGKFVISPNEFESDLKYLKEKSYNTILMSDLIAYTKGEKDLPENPIMLTFDDGYYNNYLYVFPLLKQYESKIVLAPIVV